MRSALFLTASVCGVSAAAFGVPALPSGQRVVVPAYFSLASQTDWNRITNAGTNVVAVVPEQSFANCTLDGLNCDLTAARNQFNRNSAAGQMVLAYVDTYFGCNSNQSVQAVNGNVDNLYLKYPTQIQGIFFDDGPTLDPCGCGPNSNRCGQTPLDEYAVQQHNLDLTYAHVHGTYPGSTVLINASQFPHEWVMTDPAADQAVVFEATEYDWTHNFYASHNNGQPASWWTASIYQEKLAHVIYSVPGTSVCGDVWRSKSSTYGAPNLYLYDGTAQSYDHLPSYFEQLVNAVASECPCDQTYICVCPWGDYCTTGPDTCQHICP